MVFLVFSENQTGKFCWSETQELLSRPARFAGTSAKRPCQQSASANGCIPKAFLIRDIPNLRLVFVFWICARAKPGRFVIHVEDCLRYKQPVPVEITKIPRITAILQTMIEIDFQTTVRSS